MSTTSTPQHPVTETEKVVASMLVESTGVHMLDSGDAYGRGFEHHREQAGNIMEIEDNDQRNEALGLFFRSLPQGYWSYGNDYVMASLFHLLTNRLEYVVDVDKEFQRWLTETEDDPELCNVPVLGMAEIWAKEHHCYKNAPGPYETVNTYNLDSLLDQGMQFYSYVDDQDRSMVLVSVHGGCDIRGGYTTPRAFRLIDSHESICGDDLTIEITCPCCNSSWSTKPYEDHWYHVDGRTQEIDEETDLDLDELAEVVETMENPDNPHYPIKVYASFCPKPGCGQELVADIELDY